MNIEKLKLQFYDETEPLLGGTFKDHVRDALWTWLEYKLSNQVEKPSSVAELKSKSKGFFVSYFYSLKNNAQGFGNCEIFVDEFDKNIVEQAILSENQDKEKIVIISFERL